MQGNTVLERVGSQDLGQTTGRSQVSKQLHVKKRDGSMELVDVNRIVLAVECCCEGLGEVDPLRVAIKTMGGLYDGASTRELDRLSIDTAAALITEEPEYSKFAARLLAKFIESEVAVDAALGEGNLYDVLASAMLSHQLGLLNDRSLAFVTEHRDKLNQAIRRERDRNFEYFGLQTLYDRYLLRHPQDRVVIETPQQFFMRIACALSETVEDAIELYDLFSSLSYLPSSPTLFNAGTKHEQLSSCFLLDSPQDSLRGIYDKYMDIAMLSKFSGGIGVAYSRVRSRGSLIESTNGKSNGIVPWLKTLDASVAAVNQGGKRKGACCVYLEPWHADIEAFLQLRDNTGENASRTYNLNIANWIPDLFMERVEADAAWSLFDPKEIPDLPDLYGEAFRARYEEAEKQGKALRTLPARELYARMMRTLAETGNGWITFKDKCNLACNQTGASGATVHLSNLCTEIVEVSSSGESAVCNLGSINLSRHTSINDDSVWIDFTKLAETVRTAVRQLDRVIDLNFYPIEGTKASNAKWRPIGLGIMGLQDVFFQMGVPFDAPEAQRLSKRIAEEIYYHALCASCDLAEERGAHPSFAYTRAAQGRLQFDAWNVVPASKERFESLRQRICRVGLRNSLMIAIAPTATIASIAGCYECIEPQVSNLFKRETLSGDFIQMNRYLVNDLKSLGMWSEEIRDQIKVAEGSVQELAELPERYKALYRTVWEVPMRSLIDMAADRGAFIDQSQSLNLFSESPEIGKLSSMYFYAWKKGLKTTYYLRSRPATRIAKTTVSSSAQETSSQKSRETSSSRLSPEALACSLENPESCEACQ